MHRNIALHPSWLDILQEEFEQPYMKELRDFLLSEKKSGKEIFPAGNEIFEALNITPFNEVKVLILGQDPYHGLGQAHGLSFSVRPNVPIPPSLLNIFTELHNDLNIAPAKHGHLTHWAKQGVLLLNAVLTVEKHHAASHRNRGWETFTDRIVHLLDEKGENIAFILWGAYARAKGQFIDRSRHLVLSAPHPSPLSASRGFFGSKPFSQVNAWLMDKGIEPIDWQLPVLGDNSE